MIKVLQVVAALGGGGVETLLHSYYEDMDREEFRWDIACYSHYHGVYRAKYEELGCRVWEIPSKKKLLKSFSTLYRVLRDGGYDIVHVHQDDLSFPSILAAKAAGVPVRIVHTHLGKYPHSFAGRILEKLTMPMLLRLANGYFACSEKAKKEFYPARLLDRVFIMKNGIRSRRFRFSAAERETVRRQYGFTEEQIVIGNIARIADQKNPLFLAEVFALLHARDPRYRLMLVGDGVLREQTEAKLAELGQTDCAVLTGARDDAYRYYSAMDIFVLPSLFEGLGISYIEAQTNGLPTFASLAVPKEASVSSLIEFLPLEESECGGEKPAELWARRILACKGRAEAEGVPVDDRYDISYYIKDLEEEYRKLLQWVTGDRHR